MAELDLSKFSGQQIKQLSNFKKEISTVYQTNFDLIIKRNNENYLDFVTNDKKFHFAIPEVKVAADNKLLFDVTFVPQSFSSNRRATTVVNLEQTIDIFTIWIKTVKAYYEVVNEYIDPFYKQAEKEFEDEFDLKDVTDDSATLNNENQLKVYKLLTHIEEELKKENSSNSEVQKLLSYTEEFKENLHTLPKSIIKKKAIQLLLKLRQAGIKLYYDALDVGYKEIIKVALIAAAANAEHTVINLLK